MSLLAAALAAALLAPAAARALDAGGLDLRSGSAGLQGRRGLLSGRQGHSVEVDRRSPGSKRPAAVFRFETLIVAVDAAEYSDGSWAAGEVRLLPPGTRFAGNEYKGKADRVKILVKAPAPAAPGAKASVAQALPKARELLASGAAATAPLLKGRRLSASVVAVPAAAELEAGRGEGRYWLGLTGSARAGAASFEAGRLSPAPSGRVRVEPAPGGFAARLIEAAPAKAAPAKAAPAKAP
jgi:hypothetical protein